MRHAPFAWAPVMHSRNCEKNYKQKPNGVSMDTETKTSPYWPATEREQLASVSDSSWQPASRWKALWGMKSLTSGLDGLIKSAGLLVDIWGRSARGALTPVGDILMYDFWNERVGKDRLWLGNRTGRCEPSWLSAAIQQLPLAHKIP